MVSNVVVSCVRIVVIIRYYFITCVKYMFVYMRVLQFGVEIELDVISKTA